MESQDCKETVANYDLYDMPQLKIYLDEERARTQWSLELLSVLGKWTDADFPDIEDLRKSLCADRFDWKIGIEG